MANHVLFVTDGASVHEESFFYARELAKRMELALHALVLADSGASSAERGRADKALERMTCAAKSDGISFSGRAVFGDPASELIKYLAVSPGTRFLVWGGDPGVLKESGKKHQNHWLARIRGQLDCPIAGAVGKKT